MLAFLAAASVGHTPHMGDLPRLCPRRMPHWDFVGRASRATLARRQAYGVLGKGAGNLCIGG